jgi:hypothetical protein
VKVKNSQKKCEKPLTPQMGVIILGGSHWAVHRLKIIAPKVLTENPGEWFFVAFWLSGLIYMAMPM